MVAALLIFERLTRRARFRVSRFALSRRHRQELGDRFSRSCALLVLLAYDDPFDLPGERTLARYYDYLMRALGGFLAGFHSQLPIPRDEYFDLLGRLEALSTDGQADLREAEGFQHDRSLLWSSPFLRRLGRLSSISASDFFFPRSAHPWRAQRNVPIFAAIELGRSLRRLHGVLHEIGVPDSLLEDQKRAIELCLLKAGYAQAHTVEQSELRELTWKRYCRLSLWKTNSMIEIGALIRGALDFEALRFRLGCNRFCEQIYLDDLYDLVEDTRAANAGAAHAFLREQGILASQLLRRFPDFDNSPEGTGKCVDALLETSGLLERKLDGAFLQVCPFPIPSPTGRPRDGEWRARIAEAFVNRRGEAVLSIHDLLRRRKRDWESLDSAWRAGDDRRVLQVLHVSNVPLRLVQGFLRHLDDIRLDYLPGGRPGLRGVGHYLFLRFAARLLLVRLWLAQRVVAALSSAPNAPFHPRRPPLR